MLRADTFEKPLMLWLRVGGEGDDRGWDGWMASLTQWTWVWVDFRSWWWIGRLGVLQFMGSQRVGHDCATELNHKWVLNFGKGFSVSIGIIIWFLSFNLLICCITLFDLHILKNSCIPEINPTSSWCMSFLMCCWNLFAKICWGILHLCSSVILACSFLFLCCLCLVLVSGWWWPHRMSLEVFLPLQFLE